MSDVRAGFRVGEYVRTVNTDPDHHTRIPRYARGHAGVVVAATGSWPLPDARVLGLPEQVETVYSVRFAARELWGEGTGDVMIDLWESYLRPENRSGT
jgi:nitrile hydratase